MGLKCSPTLRKPLENILAGINDSGIYIADVGAISTSWKSHIELLHTVLWHLRDNSFTVNPLKREWAIKETDWLGY